MWVRDGNEVFTESDRLILIHALCHFCNDYYSGQFSRGYRLLCRCLTWLKKQGIERPIDLKLGKTGKAIYKQLVSKYQDTI